LSKTNEYIFKKKKTNIEENKEEKNIPKNYNNHHKTKEKLEKTQMKNSFIELKPKSKNNNFNIDNEIKREGDPLIKNEENNTFNKNNNSLQDFEIDAGIIKN